MYASYLCGHYQTFQLMSILSHYQKTCRVRGESFQARKRNQLYCDQNNHQCRNWYNNEKARQTRLAMAKTENRLKSNRQILKLILETRKKQEVSHDYLLGAGFDFGIFTQTVNEAKTGIKYVCCFEYAIGLIAEKQYRIICHESKTKS